MDTFFVKSFVTLVIRSPCECEWLCLTGIHSVWSKPKCVVVCPYGSSTFASPWVTFKKFSAQDSLNAKPPKLLATMSSTTHPKAHRLTIYLLIWVRLQSRLYTHQKLQRWVLSSWGPYSFFTNGRCYGMWRCWISSPIPRTPKSWRLWTTIAKQSKLSSVRSFLPVLHLRSCI